MRSHCVPDNLMTSLARVQTRQLIFAAVLIWAAAEVCNVLDKLTWEDARPVSQFFDVANIILFWASYILLWGLLVLAPFRPRTEFSLHGSCGCRAANFFLALGALILLHLRAALALAHAIS